MADRTWQLKEYFSAQTRNFGWEYQRFTKLAGVSKIAVCQRNRGCEWVHPIVERNHQSQIRVALVQRGSYQWTKCSNRRTDSSAQWMHKQVGKGKGDIFTHIN